MEPAVPVSAVSILGSWMGPGRKSIAVESTSTPLVSAEQIDAARFIPTSSLGVRGIHISRGERTYRLHAVFAGLEIDGLVGRSR